MRNPKLSALAIVGTATAMVATAARTYESFFMFLLLIVVASGESERPIPTFPEQLRNFLEWMFRHARAAAHGRIKNPELVHAWGTGIRRRRFDQSKLGSSIRSGLFVAVQLKQRRCNRAGSQLDTLLRTFGGQRSCGSSLPR